MLLTILTLEGLSSYEKQNGLFPVRRKTHYLVEMFLACLPLKTIDGSSKIVIAASPDLSPNPNDASYYQYNGTGVSVYHLDDAQINLLYQMEPYRLQETRVQAYKRQKMNEAEGRCIMTSDQCQEYIINLIEHTLVDVAKQVSADTSVIKGIYDTSQTIRSMGYYYEKKIDKLSGISSDRRYRADVYRCLGKEIGEAWRLEINAKDGKRYREWITNIPDYLDRTDFFKYSKWENETFLIADNLRKPVITVSMNEKPPVLNGILLGRRTLCSI